jgi:hypothetical protein
MAAKRGFVYFVPGVHGGGVTRETLAEHGIEYAIEGQPESTDVTGGPGGGNGAVVADSRTPVEGRGYYADRQTWRQIPGSEAWVGWETDSPPEPDDLVRHKVLPGHEVTLGDGNPWQIPIARALVDNEKGSLEYTCTLPQTLDLDTEGKWTLGKVVSPHTLLWDDACRYWNSRIGIDTEESDIDFKFDALVGAAIRAMNTNYRINAVEAAGIGLLTTQSLHAVLEATVDWPTMQAWQKKKDET